MIDLENLQTTIITQLKHFDVEQIILFGLYAYGEPNEDSDLDLCIIKNHVKSKLKERAANS